MSGVTIRIFTFFRFLLALVVCAAVVLVAGCRPFFVASGGNPTGTDSGDPPSANGNSDSDASTASQTATKTAEVFSGAAGGILREESGDAKWVANTEPPSSQQTASVSPVGLKTELLPRTLFHFYHLERLSTGSNSKEPSTNPGKTKETNSSADGRNYTDINVLSVAKDGRHAFAGMAGGNLFALELVRENPFGRAGKPDFSIKADPLLKDTRPILGIALSPNEQYLALTRFGLVQIYDRFEHRLIAELTKVATRLVAIDWDPRSELVVFGGVGGDIYTWNVFDGPAAGKDSINAVERYSGDAPVVKLLFHPTGRAFFVAQQDGKVVFWRLLRTERELGLRDDGAKIDYDRRGSTAAGVGFLAGRPEDLWLEADGSKLYVSSVEGKVHRWRVRGLEAETELMLGPDQVSNVAQLPFVVPGRGQTFTSSIMRPFVASGRGQRLALYCPKAVDEKVNASVVSVVPSAAPAETPPPAVVVDGRIEEVTPTPVPTPVLPITSVPIAPMAESDRFDTPMVDFATGVDSAVLWAIQKGGTLVVFDASKLRTAGWFDKQLLRCFLQPGR